MTVDRYPYETWVNQALQGVLRQALHELGSEGFRGDHHLFVSFDTKYPDVRIPGFLRAQYPDEITIVLQHQFEDLIVGEESFQVSLSFSGQKHRLTVPFAAVRSFADPSVNFGLQMNQGVPQPTAQPVATPARSRIPASERPRQLASDSTREARPKFEAEQQRTGTEAGPAKGKGAGNGGNNGGTAEVIPLDTFRKK